MNPEGRVPKEFIVIIIFVLASVSFVVVPPLIVKLYPLGDKVRSNLTSNIFIYINFSCYNYCKKRNYGHGI